MIKITIPHEYTPRSYQLELLKAPQRFKIAVWNRRSGKSKTALNQQIARTQKRKGIYYYFLPTYKQAKQVIWDALVKEHIPLEIVDKLNESELAVYYKNGSIQRFAGCEDIDKHRGIGPIDIVFDEYAEINEEMWNAIIQPVLRENQGTATFIFTPKGKNHAWKLLEKAKQNPNYWYWSVKDVYETDSIPLEEIEEAKRDMTEVLFNQEFLCEFHEGAGQVFRRIKKNLYSGHLSIEADKRFRIGVDLAKHQDWTVLTPFDLTSFKVGHQDRFNQIDWNLQEARIEAMHLRYNKALIRVDSTGVGDPIYENLSKKRLPVESYQFTERSKQALFENLVILLEKDKIKLPNDIGLIEELESWQYKYDEKTKKIKMETNTTDDRVISLALAVWDLPNVPLSYQKEREREILSQFDHYKDKPLKQRGVEKYKIL